MMIATNGLLSHEWLLSTRSKSLRNNERGTNTTTLCSYYLYTCCISLVMLLSSNAQTIIRQNEHADIH
jgi:hypothetical protein